MKHRFEGNMRHAAVGRVLPCVAALGVLSVLLVLAALSLAILLALALLRSGLRIVRGVPTLPAIHARRAVPATRPAGVVRRWKRS